MRVPAGLLGDKRSLGDEERPRSAGPLRIVFLHVRKGDVSSASPESGHRCEDDAMLKLERPNLDWLEQSGGGGGGHGARKCR